MARKANVLLVEDDSGVRAALGNALLAENYRVVSAASGQEAMRQFRDNQIDIALLDLNLGLESGWDIARQLCEIKPRLSIIVMSGCPQRSHSSKPTTTAAVLEKPLDLPALFQTLDRLSADHDNPPQPDQGSGNIEERSE